MRYIVYLIECRDGSLYTGITTDIARRFQEHRQGIGSRYTRAHGVKRVVYTEECTDRSRASKREADIKRLTREEKWALVHDKN